MSEWGRFFLSIVLPTFIAILLTASAIYFVIIPAFEKSFVDGKKESIRELTKAAWSVIEFYYGEEVAGRISREEAQRRTIAVLQTIRYGEDNKDYFWITDSRPSLIMHPYSQELVGVDLSSYEDVHGKKIFQEIKKTVEQQNSGFVDYTWNKYLEKDDVPKLSFVKRFVEWDWVVGTGVFLDDVELKVSLITQRLSRLSLAALGILTIILVYVGRQSFFSEKHRNTIQQELALSRVKYKKLVETATEPILMFYEGRCIYANQSLQKMTGMDQDEIEGASLHQLFLGNSPSRHLDFVEDERIIEGEFNGKLANRDGSAIDVILAISKMQLNDQEAAVINIKDVSNTLQIEKELDQSKEKYRQLATALNIAVFRAKAERQLQLIEANTVLYSLLDIPQEETTISLQEVLTAKKTITNLFELVEQQGHIKNKILNLHSKQEIKNVSLSLVLTRDAANKPLYCEGIIEDVSAEIQREADREELIVELQTSLLFLNQSVRHVVGEYQACEGTATIQMAARQMKNSRCSSLLVQDESDKIVGIVTDMAIREKVVADELDYATPVAEIMSTPLIYVDEDALIFEAVTIMEDENIKHLVVRDGGGTVTGVISNEDLLSVHRYSSAYLIKEIEKADNVEDIVESHERLPRIIKALVDSGAHARNITRITSGVSAAVVRRFIEFAIREIGDPPCRFAFLSLGSEGREEQTLATDQDNALIYENIEDVDGRVADYFLALSSRVCNWLDQAGYQFCKGEVMAMNPQWCQPLSHWKKYFSNWITEAKPEDLLEVSIFFDFRCMYGDEELVEQLRDHVDQQVADRDAFFYQLAQNALLFKLPVDFFGNISVSSGSEHPNTFNIKHVIALITGYARLYAITASLAETNTLKRLDLLRSQSIMSEDLYEDISEAYNYLMQVRFTHQVKKLDQGLEPDNHISPDDLNYMEKSVLKKIFAQLGSLQNKLSSIGKVEIFF